MSCPRCEYATVHPSFRAAASDPYLRAYHHCASLSTIILLAFCPTLCLQSLMPLTTLEHAELRADGFSQADKERFVTLFEQLEGDLNQTIQVAGISRATYYRHCEADPAFAEAVRLAKVGLSWALVPSLFQRAKEKSDTAAMWLQKVFNPREFNPDRSSITVAVGLIGLSNRAPSPSLPASSVPIAISSTVLPSLSAPSMASALTASVSPSVDQAHTPASRPGTSQATSSP